MLRYREERNRDHAGESGAYEANLLERLEYAIHADLVRNGYDKIIHRLLAGDRADVG